MDTIAEIKEIEARLREANLPVAELLRRASVDASRWQRWKHGSEPLRSSWHRITSAYDDLMGHMSDG